MKTIKFLSLILLLLLALALSTGSVLADTPDAGWVGQYYSNRDLSGQPTTTVNESRIDHNWGDNAPFNVIPADNFSVRWTAEINFESGLYVFDVNVDDGVRLWVDGELLIDGWKEQAPTHYTAQKNLSGTHTVQLAYFDATGAALVKLNWTQANSQPAYPGYAVTWHAQYYNNASLEGNPVTVVKEPGIDYNWGYGSPLNGVSADNFSVRWTGESQFDAGDYTFSATSDDGIRVWLDGNLIIDEWHEHSETTYNAKAKLTAGTHTIQVAYFEATGEAIAKLHWVKGSAGIPGGGSNAIWQAEYFSNHTLTPPAAQTRTETSINYDWGLSSPFSGIPNDYFSARWTANINFEAGDYTFNATVDDGTRVWIDGDLIIDAWKAQPATTYAVTKHLTAGTHRVQMVHYEATGSAVAKFWWTKGAGDNNGSTPTGEKLVIDNLDEAFTWGGPLRYRHTSSGGYGNSFYWTKNVVQQPVNYAKWTPTFKQGGKYEVFIYVPAICATTQNLRYRVLHNGDRHDVILNQAQYSGEWVSLGTYTFKGNNQGKEFILAYDNTREPYATSYIAFDAVKLEPR